MLNKINEDLLALALTTYKYCRREELSTQRERALWDAGEEIESRRNQLMYNEPIEMIEYEPACG